MTTLDVKKLTSCGSDWEANQYMLLSRVKLWTDQIHKNKLYPALSESIQLNLIFEEILKENLESKWWFDSEIKARKLNERITIYEKANQIGFQLDKLLEFVEWALYLNRPVLIEAEIAVAVDLTCLRCGRLHRRLRRTSGVRQRSDPGTTADRLGCSPNSVSPRLIACRLETSRFPDYRDWPE